MEAMAGKQRLQPDQPTGRHHRGTIPTPGVRQHDRWRGTRTGCEIMRCIADALFD
jgi:hypothetical protein